MYHRFLWWVHKFFLVLSFQIFVVLALCFLLKPTFRKLMLPLVSLVFGNANDVTECKYLNVTHKMKVVDQYI